MKSQSYLDQVRPGAVRRFALRVRDYDNSTKRASVDWYMKQINKLNVTPQRFLMNEKRSESGIDIGDMYFFRYVAKHRETLPYWDMYPLIFPFNILDNGFLGLNMHYIHPKARAVLLDALEQVSKKRDKMAISWQVLQSASQLPFIRHCVKRYLFTQVSSHFVKIEKKDWLAALLMPTQQFRKESAETVWSKV